MSIESPTNAEEFIRHCKARLSFLKINITPDQEKILLQRAKKKFLEYHHESTEKVYVKQKITQEDLDRGYFITPPEVFEVNNLLSYRAARSFSQSMIYDLEIRYSLYNGFSSHNTSPFDTATSPIVTYWLARMDASLFNSHFNRDDEFRWSRVSRRLIVEGNPLFKVDNYILYEADISLENEERFWQTEWFIDYMVALLKMTWGENLTKFSNVELPGGMTLNGAELKAEGKARIDELEEELLTTHSNYTMMYIS